MELLKKIKNKIVRLFNSYIWNPMHFKWMKNKANRLNKLTGKRYFVVPATDTSLMVVDNNYVKFYNKQKGVKKIDIYDLIKMSYYATSTRSLVS